jgi:CheY-like chemotaxis protein
MSQEYLTNIFEAFTREQNTTKSKIAGTGLGMSIVKKYVDLLGGTINVESELGKGSTFTVTLKHRIADESYYVKNNDENPETCSEILEGKNILLAEDNDLNAELATVMLEDAGMVVTRASDGKEAVERFKNHPRGTYDIILMDIMMPNMDGHQAAKTIRAMEKERPDASSIPIIALSANAFAEDVKASVDSGMNGHISKPFDMEEVTATIAKYVKP